MCTDIGSKCRQREGFRIAWGQSIVLSEETYSNLALYASEVNEWSKRFQYTLLLDLPSESMGENLAHFI